MAGQASRLYYDHAMRQLEKKQTEHKEDPQALKQIEADAVDLMLAHR